MRRNTDAENGFGDIMPEATVHIRPLRDGDVPFRIQGFDNLNGQHGTSSRTVGVTGTTAATVVTATYISVPASSTVYIEALVSAFCTAGAAAGSALALQIRAMASSAGASIVTSMTGLSSDNAITNLWGADLTCGTNYVGLTVTGSANTKIKWVYDVTTVTLLV